MEKALERQGIVRRKSESVQRLARRLEQELEPEYAHDGAALLRRYDALRFGNIGDESELDRDIAGYVQRLAKISRDHPPAVESSR